MVKRRHIARDLLHVRQRDAGQLVALVEQKVGERRLGALNLRGEYRLLAHIQVQEKRAIRQQGGEPVQTPERAIGALGEVVKLRVPLYRGCGGSEFGTNAENGSGWPIERTYRPCNPR